MFWSYFSSQYIFIVYFIKNNTTEITADLEAARLAPSSSRHAQYVNAVDEWINIFDIVFQIENISKIL